MEALEKKLVQLENELSQTTTNLENSNTKLEEREKALQNVSLTCMTVNDNTCQFFKKKIFINPEFFIILTYKVQPKHK